MSMQGLLVLENVGSPEVTKLYGEEALGGSRAETGGVVTKGKKAPKRTMSEAGEIAEKVLRYSKLGKVPEIIGKTGQLLISKPDQYVSRPLWFGTFAKSFNESTGKEVDFDKIAEDIFEAPLTIRYQDSVLVLGNKQRLNIFLSETFEDLENNNYGYSIINDWESKTLDENIVSLTMSYTRFLKDSSVMGEFNREASYILKKNNNGEYKIKSLIPKTPIQ